jgi:hypothetical protein
VGLLLVVALWQASQFVWNGCDDDGAYLYLARRLIETGDLLDPLNNRRVTSLGGMSSLQALFLGRLGDAVLPLADLFLGPLLVMVQLWRTSAGKWSVWGIAAAFVIALFPAHLGINNSSPVLLPVGLSLAAYRWTLRMRAPADVGERADDGEPAARTSLALGAALGLVVAAAGTLRPQFALALVPFAVAMTLLPPFSRSNGYRLAGLVVGGVLGLSGWALASWRAVGTPLFPLVGGNVDPTWPATGPDRAGPTAFDLVNNLGSVLTVSYVWLALLLAGLVLIGLWVTERGAQRRTAVGWAARTLVLATGGIVLLLAVLGIVWWSSGDLVSFPRFWMPLLVATVLIPLAALNASRSAGWDAAVLGFAALATVVVAVTYDASWHADSRDLVPDMVSGRSLDVLAADRYAHVRPEYAHVSTMIAPGSKVLTTVDVPSLLLGHDFDVHTLDLVGSTSPSPRLPYFDGPAAKLAWARDQGYDYIVTVDPAVGACHYNAGAQEQNLAAGGVYGSWAPWYLDWFQFVDELSASPSLPGTAATRVGSLILVEL